ncbi:GNAT family N-acetyltransferase [Oceanibacterium hippocampi]|uniref:GNAT family N-acetyltransferase n=1 Tax=Oceanibacterium hippocampi TaxID=745714 RepID=UPI00111C2CF8|nr:GNAT family N-acetyltransferase [Oceanibacterium hippocampi]
MSTEDLTRVALGQGHIGAALTLSCAAHWNQSASDWRLMIGQGGGIGLEDGNGTLVASAITLPYARDVAWISMVLVRQDWQRRGLASDLLVQCIEAVESRGLIPALDATPAGEKVYLPLGFVPIFRFQRYELDLGKPAMPQGKGDPSPDPETFEALAALDAEAAGAGRPAILADLVARAPGAVCRLDAPEQGFVLARPGRNAWQIGPLVADSVDGARRLFDRALARAAQRRVFIDVPDGQDAFRRHVEAAGFSPQRPFTRMYKGRDRAFGRPELTFAVAGPELG